MIEFQARLLRASCARIMSVFHEEAVVFNSMLPSSMLDLLVIGGASLDVYHLADGQTVQSPGGAGLYTALAAYKSGARTGMFAPRPEPLPDELQAAAECITWIGPMVSLDQLPHFEIAHYGGGRAALLNASWGGEMSITPENFPHDQIDAPIIHIAALRTAERQLRFAQALRMRKADFGMPSEISDPTAFRISAGTYSKICTSEPDTVRKLISLCDFFFMNQNEANLLFGGVDKVKAQPGQMIFITLGERGALAIQGDHVTTVPGHPTAELDPTGAGDTFCGATLAALARGEHPARAAQSAVMLAAEMIGAVGPARLLSDQPAPHPIIDPRVRVDSDQVERISQLIARLPEVQPFNFTGDFFPPIDHPATLDFFFAATLQQFGFWEMTPHPHYPPLSIRGGWGLEVRRYSHPMIALLEGCSRKGSDYLFAAYRRLLDRDASFLTPDRQAALTADEFGAVLRADDGSNPMPAFDLHLQAAQAYGRDMGTLNWTPQQIVEMASHSPNPRTTFLSLLDHIGGYKEDPLRKKSMLLALMLEQRPEKFLRPVLTEAEPPVIDYHLMRSCLRTGLVEVTDDDLRRRVIGREELSEQDEGAVRHAAYQAVQQVQQRSGRSMGAVDWFFFNARRRCPEMTEPQCANCVIDPVCVHRKELFQPVRRTTFY
jgi:ribokinase